MRRNVSALVLALALAGSGCTPRSRTIRSRNWSMLKSPMTLIKCGQLCRFPNRLPEAVRVLFALPASAAQNRVWRLWGSCWSTYDSGETLQHYRDSH